jgi:hypothetical protein
VPCARWSTASSSARSTRPAYRWQKKVESGMRSWSGESLHRQRGREARGPPRRSRLERERRDRLAQRRKARSAPAVEGSARRRRARGARIDNLMPKILAAVEPRRRSRDRRPMRRLRHASRPAASMAPLLRSTPEGGVRVGARARSARGTARPRVERGATYALVGRSGCREDRGGILDPALGQPAGITAAGSSSTAATS